MKRTIQGAFVAGLATLASAAAMAATCMAVTQGTVTVDGIIVPRQAVSAAPGCPSAAPDRGWGGVIGENLVVPSGRTHGPQEGTLFVTAQEEGDKIKRVHIGLRVLNAPDFTSNDKFTFYFHAGSAGGNWDAANDFALAFGGIGPQAATPAGQDGCANVGNAPLYYKRNTENTAWVPQGAVPTGISFRTSFDYETVRDPQAETWQLEIAVDLSALNPNLTVTRGGQIGFGGKLYLFNPGVSSTTPLYFPAQVAPNDVFLDVNPNQGGVTPATLEKFVIGCPYNVAVSGVEITSSRGTPGKFTLLNSSDFDSAGILPSSKQSLLAATLHFVNPADPSDARPVATPNQGTVKFSFDVEFINTGGRMVIPVRDMNASFVRLGDKVAVSFPWPPNRNEYGSCCDGPLRFSEVSRLRVEIVDFNADQGANNDAARPFTFD